MIKVVILMLLFFSWSARAVEVQLYPLGSESRYQQNQDQDLVFRNARTLAFGVQEGPWSLLIERSEYNEAYGNSVLRTEHRLVSYLMTGRWTLFDFSKAHHPRLQLMPSLGVGMHQDEVTTSLLDTGTKDVSAWESLASAGLVLKMKVAQMGAELEGRVSQGRLLDPMVAYGLVLRVGIVF